MVLNLQKWLSVLLIILVQIHRRKSDKFPILHSSGTTQEMMLKMQLNTSVGRFLMIVLFVLILIGVFKKEGSGAVAEVVVRWFIAPFRVFSTLPDMIYISCNLNFFFFFYYYPLFRFGMNIAQIMIQISFQNWPLYHLQFFNTFLPLIG